MREDRTPVLVGAAQLLQRDVALGESLDPVSMLEQVARRAADDARVGEAALERLDCVGIVDVLAWQPKNAPRMVADRLGAKPGREYVTAVGGEAALAMLNRVGEEIESGELSVAFLGGCNLVSTLKRAYEQGAKLGWPKAGEGEPTLLGRVTEGTSERERAYGLAMPTDVYPLFENALRARRGLSLDEHLSRVGALFSRFSEVAAENPYAWFPTARSPEELVTPTVTNRLIAYPYTKYLNAVLETDQAAGVLVMSADAARTLGVPEERWAYWRGGARTEEVAWYPSERPDFARCPALRASIQHALDRSGVTLDAVDWMDLYSCFPSAVEMACEMLDLAEDDPRGFTLTGGLPYAGGPGNNYTLHAVAAMLDRIRERGGVGLVTGNGWYLTKHSATVLAAEPSSARAASRSEIVEVDSAGQTPVDVIDEASGNAKILTYTVLYDRDGAPKRGIVIGALESGPRFIANTPDDRALLEDLVSREAVGRSGTVASIDAINRFIPS